MMNFKHVTKVHAPELSRTARGSEMSRRPGHNLRATGRPEAASRPPALQETRCWPALACMLARTMAVICAERNPLARLTGQ
jgi:hypothetical protein